jgi:hypothetical protein
MVGVKSTLTLTGREEEGGTRNGYEKGFFHSDGGSIPGGLGGTFPGGRSDEQFGITGIRDLGVLDGGGNGESAESGIEHPLREGVDEYRHGGIWNLGILGGGGNGESARFGTEKLLASDRCFSGEKGTDIRT